jgi:uncharacterized protein
MILKILLVLAVIGIVYFMFIKKKPPKQASEVKQKKKEKLQSNDMVECASCGVYSEVGDSILSGNKYYCSDECLKEA